MAKKTTVAWDVNAEAATNAYRHLPALADEYFGAGRKLLKGRHSPHTMHKFRLRTKHFRYTLELFRNVYGVTMDARLEMLKPIQDSLGDLNDCVTARQLLGDRSRKMHSYLKKRAKKKVAEFKEGWRDSFDTPGRKEEWLQYLAGGESPQ